jgi:hypothetical protein
MAVPVGKTDAEDISSIICTKEDALELSEELQRLYSDPLSVEEDETVQYIFSQGELRRVWLVIATEHAGGKKASGDLGWATNLRREAQITFGGTGGTATQNEEKVERSIRYWSPTGAFVSELPPGFEEGIWGPTGNFTPTGKKTVIGNAEQLRAKKFANGIGSPGHWVINPFLKWAHKWK